MTPLVDVSSHAIDTAIALIDIDVTVLDFGRCHGEHVPYLKAFAEALAQSPYLTHLYFSENEIGDAGFLKLGRAIGTLSKLRVLDLSYNDFGSAGLEALCPHLARLPLKKLDLSINAIDGTGLITLGKALRTSKTLKCLYLYGTAVTFNDCLRLLQDLSNVHTLMELIVDETRVTRAEIKLLNKRRPQICFSYWN